MGMEGSYRITLKSQLGPKNGIFVVSEQEKKLLVTFTFLGRENILIGREKTGNFKIEGEITTPLGLRQCQVKGHLNSIGLSADIIINGKSYPITGMKVDDKLEREDK